MTPILLKRSLFVAVFTLVTVISFCQITVTNATFPVAGDTLFTVLDASPNISLGNEGGNQNWDFTSLNGPFVRQQLFLDPSEGTAGSDFTDATMVALLENNQEVYYQSFNNKIIEVGRAGEFVAGFDIPVTYEEQPTFRRAPLSYQDVNDDDGVLSVSVSAAILPEELLASFPIQVDSIRITLDSQIESVVDAWGTIQLPNSTHEVIREKSINTTETKLFAKTFIGWNEIPQELLGGLGDLADAFGVTVTTTYNFMSNDSKEIIASVLVDEEDQVTSVEYMERSVVSSISVVNNKTKDVIAYPNPSFGNVSIQLVNYPKDKYHMEVYNVVGKKLWKETFDLGSNRVFKADLTHLRKGTYLYSIFDKNGKKIVTKRLAIMGL